LVGPWLTRAAADPASPITVGRIGLLQRVTLDPGIRVLAVVGDRIVTVRRHGERTRIGFRSFDSSAPPLADIDWPGLVSFSGIISGPYVLTSSGDATQDPGGEGVVLISATDGGARWLMEPQLPAGGPATGDDLPALLISASASGEAAAWSTCRAGIEEPFDCGPLTVADVDTGVVRGSVTTDGQYPAGMTADAVLLRDDALGLRLVEIATGRMVWSRQSTAADPVLFGFTHFLGDGTLIVEASAGVGAEHRDQIIAIDPGSGTERVVFDRDTSEAWRVWPALSTTSFLAMGHEAFPPCSIGSGGCSPDELRTVDAATLDLATLTLVEGAIHYAIRP
jgi:hypothetical protein